MKSNQFNRLQHEELQQNSPNDNENQTNSESIQIDGLEINNNNNINKIDDDEISAENNRFPYCIVWTALPFITWFIPFIGHTGIALSNGIIHDFAGPYYISIDNFAFGKPLNNNCHSHVADALNHMGYLGSTKWNMVSVWFICLWSSKYVSWWTLFVTYIPFIIIFGLISLFCFV